MAEYALPNLSNDLSGRVALVTGASSGLGYRFAQVIAACGAKVAIAAKQPGSMVNISSVGGFNYGGNGAALYSITKSAIVRMTECLAVEWARYHINVNAIAPGCFDSEMMDGMLERMGDIARFFPRKRICDPEEMDSTLLYFLSPASAAVTGTYIKIDDGQGSRWPGNRTAVAIWKTAARRPPGVRHQTR